MDCFSSILTSKMILREFSSRCQAFEMGRKSKAYRISNLNRSESQGLRGKKLSHHICDLQGVF